MAPFARTATWDPARSDGARAKRTEEFRAEDLFLETELAADRDGWFAVPVWSNRLGCIGLQWLNRRALRQLTLEFADESTAPQPDAVRVEGWFGESAWQGHWRALTNEIRRDGARLISKITAPPGFVQTRKVRWIVPLGERPVRVRLEALTDSTWSTTNVVAVFDGPPTGARSKVRITNGAFLSATNPTAHELETTWPLDQPLSLTVRFSHPSPLHSDPTILRFDLPDGDVGVAVADVLSNDCVYVPDLRLFVSRDPAPVTLAEYKQRIAGRKTILEEVRAMPDQTLEQAMARTHREVQRAGPVLLSLAAANTKFVLEREGALRCVVTPNPVVSKHRTRLELQPVFGGGNPTNLTRTLEGGWLPIPVIEVHQGGVTYRQRTFVAPSDSAGQTPTRLDRRSVCVVEFTITNQQAAPVEPALTLHLRVPEGQPVQLLSKPRGWQIVHQDAQLGFIAARKMEPLVAQTQEGTLRFTGTLPPGGASRCVVLLPAEPDTHLGALGVRYLRGAVETYWRAVLARGALIETPDPLLNNLIRSSLVRCWIAARNEAQGTRIAPWIAAMAYGPLESEAHSIIRGMDLLGHEEFARRALDFFIHRYNTNGFLTTGYTTFGTAWHLWTLGEHYAWTRDRDWLKQVAPEVARVGHWIIRQTEKTRLLDARRQPVPEYGLMPPGVLADWDAYAYHFTMNGYYVAALREIGHALEDIGHPDSELFLKHASELRRNVLRAYLWTQARSPARPLRDGTWIPHYPSQVHSPGPLADFFPGEDVGRSWCYDVELGAHQLVPTRVLSARGREVDRMLNHMEDVQFLADGWFDYPAAANQADWFNLGGFSKVQPYYTRVGEIYAMRDDVKPFVRTYFNSLASLLNPEVLTFWEHFHHHGAWDKTHETGYFLQQTRFMLVMEHDKALWLAPLIPSHWLRDGALINAQRLATRFGPVSFRIHAQTAQGRILARIEPPTRTRPDLVVLRLRHPDGQPIKRVLVNGRDHTDFDRRNGEIRLRGADTVQGAWQVRAEY
ncbi:MAG: hypothetical protein N3I86_13335 [Verrucomicrobiae bacterium]|nr:hypothetical protein [Verrucomicrobiae bacterium]